MVKEITLTQSHAQNYNLNIINCIICINNLNNNYINIITNRLLHLLTSLVNECKIQKLIFIIHATFGNKILNHHFQNSYHIDYSTFTPDVLRNATGLCE